MDSSPGDANIRVDVPESRDVSGCLSLSSTASGRGGVADVFSTNRDWCPGLRTLGQRRAV